MSSLKELPNIGEALEKLLIQVGIDTPEKLRAIGAQEAFLRLRIHDPTSCHSKLYALYGAEKGIRWHKISAEEKQQLNDFYKGMV